MSFACWRVTMTLATTTTVGCFSPRYGSGFRCRADALPGHANGGPNGKKKKKIVVVGSGWAGLGAAHHLCNQVCLCFLTHSFFCIALYALFLLGFFLRASMSRFLKVIIMVLVAWMMWVSVVIMQFLCFCFPPNVKHVL